MIQVSPSDLRGRVAPNVRRAIRSGTAVPTPAMRSQGNLGKLLDDSLRTRAVQQSFTALSNDALRSRLADALVDREGDAYRQQPMFAEHIEDVIDDVEAELERRGVPVPCR